ncbi:MAG: hypothetical protein JWM80_4206 [Cyanobacteria bacterium RYN_339]|nr:hypothetical protein [Cyanobacteria bacterium RYN_339]
MPIQRPWAIALPRIQTNAAHLNGRNLVYTPEGGFKVSIPYVTADMIDKTPGDPLDVFAFGTYAMKVQAARIEMTQQDLNVAMQVATAGNQQVSSLHGELLDGNRLAVGGTLRFHGIPVPFSARVRAGVTGPSGVRLDPEALKVFCIPVRWALRFVDVGKLVPGGLVAKGPNGSFQVDISGVEAFKGDLTGLEVTNGKLAVRIGGQPGPDVARSRRANDPNYCEIISTGEVTLEAGIIRNAKVVIIDDTPNDPYSLNKWDKEGYARLESGQVVLTLDKLRARFANVGGGFIVKSVGMAGTDLVVTGQKEILGLPIPVNFKVRFAPTADGRLKLTPHDVHVAGIGFGQSQIVDAMAGMAGMKRDGDGVILDMRASNQVQMPPIKRVTSEAGRIVLNT